MSFPLARTAAPIIGAAFYVAILVTVLRLSCFNADVTPGDSATGISLHAYEGGRTSARSVGVLEIGRLLALAGLGVGEEDGEMVALHDDSDVNNGAVVILLWIGENELRHRLNLQALRTNLSDYNRLPLQHN